MPLQQEPRGPFYTEDKEISGRKSVEFHRLMSEDTAHKTRDDMEVAEDHGTRPGISSSRPLNRFLQISLAFQLNLGYYSRCEIRNCSAHVTKDTSNLRSSIGLMIPYDKNYSIS